MNKDLKFEEYPFNVPNKKRLCQKIEILVTNIEKSQSADELISNVKKFSKFSEKVETDISIIYVLYSCHTDNEKYAKAQETVDEITPFLSAYINRVAKFVSSCQFRKDVEKAFGPYYLKMIDNSLKSFDEKIIPELIQENKLSSEYDRILGGAQIEFDGKILNLSQLGKYMSNKDREVRKAATIAMDKWLGEHEQEIANIYDQLVHLRDQEAKKLGFKNFVELGYLKLGRCDYNAEMVANYRKQIAETVVPLCNKLYKQQVKLIGVKNPQSFDYNLVFKSGNPEPAGDQKYLVDQAYSMYSDLGKEAKEFFEFMIAHNLMDLDARAGKAPGGYCTYFPLYKAPFIFSNFNGTEGDVNVLTHEGGHALQAYLSSNIKVPEYRSPTLEACEIHSMSMEFFAWPYMEGFFGKDANKYMYLHLTDAIKFLPYGITIDEFQHWVYENPNASHEERCAKFKEIETKYTPHKVYDYCPTLNKGTYWMRQSHVFGTPFYYIDYTLAQVAAFQFFDEMNKNHDKAWKKYVKLCKFGGKAPFVELLAKNHLRNPFEDGNVAKAIKPLVKILKQFDVESMN